MNAVSPAILGLASVLASADATHAQLRTVPGAEWRNERYGYELNMPPGTTLCMGPEESSTFDPLMIPVQAITLCDDLSQLFMIQNRVVVDAHYDTDQYENLGQYASALCESLARIRLVASATIRRAGGLLGGLETMICELQLLDGYFVKVAVARKGGRDAAPINFSVAVEAPIDQEAEAEALWRNAVGSFHLIR
jgi:hypothetical protein